MNIVFLRKFTQELILNSKSKEEPLPYSQELKLETQIPNISNLMNQEIEKLNYTKQTQNPVYSEEKRQRTRLNIPSYFKLKPENEKPNPFKQQENQQTQKTNSNSQSSTHPQKQKYQSSLNTRKSFPRKQKLKPIMKRQLPKYQPRQISSQQLDINLGKINQLIQDPKVTKIECKGPGKNIILSKMGIINTTDIVLTEQEINNIIKEFGQKTRIPIVGGTFKAMYNDLLITAIISSDIGSRFIIERKNAFSLIQSS